MDEAVPKAAKEVLVKLTIKGPTAFTVVMYYQLVPGIAAHRNFRRRG